MMDNLLPNALLSIVFAILGFVLMFVGYKVFDVLTPTRMADKIFQEGNVAVGVFAGAFILGLAIIVAAAIS